ncbi:ATP-dependent DNA helicase RecG [Lapillicoccus jejuensis]|uniref:ATP-dependent DNA helicase RecG n=1 Tax=Lapillicoccus jejuensis TaxID=402171 RepID=UPI001FEB5139|nr:ATP-dependent DNA helicase RecG [Lapillicoccus jejuensis]
MTAVVSAPVAKSLEKARGVVRVGDLLELVPRAYLNPGRLSAFSELREGEHAVVVARVAEAKTRPMRQKRKTMLTAVLRDEQGATLDLTFFSAWGHVDKLLPGRVGVFSGTVSVFNRRLQLAHPEYEMLEHDAGDASDEVVSRFAEHLMPVYPVTGGVTSPKLRRLVQHAFEQLERIREPLPAEVRLRRGLLGREAALRRVHAPRLDDDLDEARRRLRYDEAFVLQTILAQRRARTEALAATSRVATPGGLRDAFDARLPFELTPGQVAVGEEIEADLARPRPMHRLLQGEVGSGKTVIALRAMLTVVDAGGQAALLAPTEVLAAQHARSLRLLLGDLAEAGMLGGSAIGTRVELLTGSQPAAVRRRVLNDVVTGDAGIVVGTHALIQQHVAFHDLALVVVDEQHRFGVEQRDALREKASAPPHLLVMTATPIPRTVAMTVFGDMETSTLRELPRGRSPITTHVVDAARESWVRRTWERVAEEVAAGHQAYVVCPKIGDDGPPDGEEELDEAPADDDLPPEGPDEGPRPLTGVLEMAERLAAEPALAGLRIAVLHGRMDPDTKDAVMRAFGAGELDVLVATTVIEVGVDVPNASVMVVVDADRFGISQLHQLRGRVGRGAVPGLCLLLTTAPPDGPTGERLKAVEATTDGFELARRDLQLRREGDVLGARQSGGRSSVRFLRMGHRDDETLIEQAREDATAVVARDPGLRTHPDLAARVAARLDEEQAAYLERG